jgi:dTDP-4-amino-4,6-dideoxygalactose transaminase
VGIGNDLTGDLEHLLTRRVLHRKALFRMIGPMSQSWRAEKEIEQMYAGMHCLLLPSSTLGLSLLLEVLDLPAGKEVLISPFGWVSNWSCIQRAGQVPRFMPLNEDLQLETREVERRINTRTAAVIVTHLLGRGQQAVGEIAGLCAERGIPLLEDIAQSFGVSVRGQRTGTFGFGSWCSLNHHKILSTGDGGFVLIRDEEAFSRVSARHDQGNVMSAGKRVAPASARPGLSLRVNELTAAVLRAQLARYPLVRARIHRLHAALAAALHDELGLALVEPHDGDIPFNVIFRRLQQMAYPSLADSGWHLAGNVPWLAEALADASRTDPAVAETIRVLTATAVVGAGFVDKYFGMPLGLAITDAPSRASEITSALKQAL